MSEIITKQQLLWLVGDEYFKSEKEFEEYIIPRLIKLFKIKPSQIDRQSITTSFDYTLSNCADIVIRTDDNFERAMVVIELKLSRNVEKYKEGSYEESRKQLNKYCQDVRALYGILLTDIDCHVFENKYFFKDQKWKRNESDCLPGIDIIERRMTFNALVDFIFRKYSEKYVVRFIIGFIIFGSIINYFIFKFGILLGLLIELLVVLIIVGLVVLLVRRKRILD
jgi:hypothetical protein